MQEEYSVAVWVKPLGNHYHYNGTIFSSGDWNKTRYSFGLSQDNSQVDILCKGHNNYLTCAVPINTWTHLICTCDSNNIVRLYKNGEYINSSARSDKPDSDNLNQAAIGRETYANGYFTFNGMLNDFRLYDHCLSLMEIKEISKGLILHYPLNRNGWGQDNILPQTNELTAWVKESNVTCVKENDWFVITDVKARSARWGVYKNDVIIKPNTDYAFSVECEGSTSIQLCTNSSLTNKIQIIYNQQGKKSGTFNTGELFGTDDICYMRVYIWPTYANNHESKVRYFKIEEGTKITPWCPNSSDELYNILGLNNNIQYDTSGYGNNGTRTGTFSWTSDTPKYQVSTHAVGSSTTHLEGPPLPAEAKTVALWIKGNKSTNGAIFNDKTSGLQIGLLNSLLYMNSLAATAGFTTSHWKDGQWNHVVAVNNNGTRSLYVNGQPETQSGANNYYIHNADNFWLWNRSYNNAYAWTGDLSDLRIYVTALSTEDVKSLYNNSAYIDNQGNIYGAVYEEV